MFIRGVVSAHDNTKEGVAMSRWQDKFKDDTKVMQKDSKEGYTGWAVDVEWLGEQVERYREMKGKAKNEEDKKKYSYFVFVVTRDKHDWGEHKKEKIVDTEKKCRLWIRGFRSYESFCEDFPPIQWP